MMWVFVLLFKISPDQEGIHTLRVRDRSLVLMFEDEDDATRYAMLLEAQDFMAPAVEKIDRQEVEEYCDSVNYDYRLVPKGFIPKSAEDRLLISPPETNIDPNFDDPGFDQTEDWRADHAVPQAQEEPTEFSQAELDQIRRRLEGLL
jgi:hypothetical protein